ncbi:hypothetical protein KC19_VG275700 [Ceratodon purpureus]|uniref:DUF4283 domain-containing protein n=1 Tax=Ceratodon purpureus TaxID=3225 RepID=A0A8T0HU84_CERPU|nr:hypothetical protein KC19_VG275700 [Ceratodon purpureus]
MAKNIPSLVGFLDQTPSQSKLNKWGRRTLNSSFSDITCKGKGYFKAHVKSPLDKQHTLALADHRIFNSIFLFVEWTPHFQPDRAGAKGLLQYPLWVQVKGLPLFLKTEEFLREVIRQFSTVVYVKNSDTYRSRMLGLRVRIIPVETHRLHDTVIIPRIDGDGGVYHDLVYTGVQDQCKRCHRRGHTIRHCPTPKLQNKKHHSKPKPP